MQAKSTSNSRVRLYPQVMQVFLRLSSTETGKLYSNDIKTDLSLAELRQCMEESLDETLPWCGWPGARFFYIRITTAIFYSEEDRIEPKVIWANNYTTLKLYQHFDSLLSSAITRWEQKIKAKAV